MLYFGIETGTSKTKYIFCKILHLPIESILLKKAYIFSKGLLQHFKEQSGL